MKASEAPLLSFLSKSSQFIIPIYQRTYSWTEKECQQLWGDIVRAGENDDINVHFVGSIVYIEEGLSQITHQSPLLVIDGQQRLATLTLLLVALSEALGDDEPLDGFTSSKIRNRYLVDNEEKDDRHFKLMLSQTDKGTLNSLVAGKKIPAENSIRIIQNFEFFQAELKKYQSKLDIICKGLSKLVVVDIALTRDQDNPQLIFESMNSTGRELSQADLIRNFILMGLEADLQTRLYEEYWRPMEIEFGQEAYTDFFDSFMRHYLTLKTGSIPRLHEVYEAFKTFARSPKTEGAGIEELVKDLHAYAGYYCAMALNAETSSLLKMAFDDLRELKVDVAYPFLLELYNDYSSGLLSEDHFEQAIRLVEAFVFRRAICSIPTNSLNKTFATFTRALKKGRYLEGIEAHFLLLPSYRRFPTDEEFHREIQTRDLYNFRSRGYWLRRLENYDRKERVPVDEYTIEHILPQNPDLSEIWQQELGEDWQNIQEQWLHTLGNLTLTGYNSEYSDRPFSEKRDMKGGFKDSPLRLNNGLGQCNSWDVDTIKNRAQKLATQAAGVWRAPTLSDGELNQYRPTEKAKETYTIDDHSHLHSGNVGAIFDLLRREIKALDPGVSEEFLKLYVAYKAETNFVDIVPQSQQMRITLNMRFSEIIDPREMCMDVTNLGRWGNGDVEFKLGRQEDIPYVMGLIRQSLEKQLGNGSVN